MARAMAEENRRLKRMYADVSMLNDLLKDALGKNDPASSTPSVGRESGGDEAGPMRVTWSALHGRDRGNGRSRVETKVDCVQLLGQRLMARDFDR